MNMRFLLLPLLFCITNVFGNASNYYVIDGKNEDNGMIKIWYTMLGLLDDYDQNRCAGFEISFQNDGKHFDSSLGANWWSYYFEQNAFGAPKKDFSVRIPRYQRAIIRFKTVCTMSSERGNFLLNKYVRLQPNIYQALDRIKKNYWGDLPVVGVYYQKPIMSEVQKSWSALDLCERVQQEIKDLKNCKICLFTDLENYYLEFQHYFGEQCFYISDLTNYADTSCAQRGEHELLTLLLLAQCDRVIAPGSYQATGVKMLNPSLQVVELDTIPYACV